MTAAVLGLIAALGVPAAVVLLCLGFEDPDTDPGRPFPGGRSTSRGGG